MELKEAIEKLNALERQIFAYEHAQGLLEYDAATVAPKRSTDARSVTLAALSAASFGLLVNEQTGALLQFLSQRADALDGQTARRVQLLLEEYDKFRRLPMQVYIDFVVLRNEAETVWRAAKTNNDFAGFSPCLSKLVEKAIELAGYYAPEKDPYDVWLNENERGLDTARCDAHFSAIRTRLVPFIKRIVEKQYPQYPFMNRSYPIDTQRAFSSALMSLLTLDKDRCILGETEHPFTTNFSKYDVRITTKYSENAFVSSMFSVIHEGGHALYELNTDDALQYTCLGSGISMGIHESQSRFFENYIGRSRAFAGVLLDSVRSLFPEQVADADAQSFYRAVNRVAPSLIRVEADELTYPLHILIRYELEKALFHREITVEQLPACWAAKYKEYLGVDVPDDTNGVLQDIHWAQGSFGYFPSYSIGNAYAAQLLDAMKKDVDVDGCAARGDLAPVVEWLRTKIYRFGRLFDPDKLIESCCGAPADDSYYTEYLIKKYSEIYGLQ